jgi:hypothetical protein
MLIAGVACTGLALAAVRVLPAAQARAIDMHMPVAATSWILENDPGGRPFNTYSWGGYLGWRQPDRPVFIDGRADIYGEGPIRAYARAVTLEDDPGLLLDAFEVDYVLFGVDTPLAGWLDEGEDWARVYADELAAVWVRSGD